jgi:hypothetical protein
MSSTAASATRHGVHVIVQLPVQPGLDYRFNVAGDEGKHADTLSQDHHFNIPGYGSAYQLANAFFPQEPNLGGDLVFVQMDLASIDPSVSPYVQDYGLRCGIEDGGHSLVPYRYRQLHTF